MPKNYILDNIDLKILQKLDENARISATHISQWLGESKQVVSVRIRKLASLEIISHTSAIINKTKLGYFHCQMYLKLQKTPNDENILQRLSPIPQLHWECASFGTYQLAIYFFVKSLDQCWNTYEKILSSFSDVCVGKEILLTSRSYFFNHACVTGAEKKMETMEYPRQEIRLKPRDYDLINAMKEQGRIQINMLSKKIHITPYTIRQRIAYLKRKKVITGFKMRFNENLLGFHQYIILANFRGLTDERKKSFINALSRDISVIKISETMGQWDLAIHILLKKGVAPKSWLHDIKNDLLSGITFDVLRIKKIFPINTVRYS